MNRALLILLLCSVPMMATAATVDPTIVTYDWIKVATDSLNSKLTQIGFKLFFILTLLQMTITLIGLVNSGDIEVVFGKMAKAMLWTSFCLFLMTNNYAYNFIADTIQYFLNNAISWTTASNADFSANGIIQNGLTGFSDTTKALEKSILPTTPTGMMSFLARNGTGALASVIIAAITLGVVIITILVTTAYIALKTFMIKVEAALLLAVLPFSLALLGLNALREQGFAPFKSMLALIYRIVILGIVVGGMSHVGSTLNSYANSEADPNILQMALVAVFGYLLLAFIAYKADQIAGALASGSANLGSGDMVGAALAGAAAGGAVTAAIQGAMGLAGGASSSAKSMGDVIKDMNNAGSISNGSPRGTGITPPSAPPRPLASVSSFYASTGKYSIAPSGAPRRDDASFSSTSSTVPSQVANEEIQNEQNGSSSHGETPAYSVGSQPGAARIAPSGGNEPTGMSLRAPSAINDSQPAGIEGVPQRTHGDLVSTAPKRTEKPSERLRANLAKLAEHSGHEKHATHVSINTHHE